MAYVGLTCMLVGVIVVLVRSTAVLMYQRKCSEEVCNQTDLCRKSDVPAICWNVQDTSKGTSCQCCKNCYSGRYLYCPRLPDENGGEGCTLFKCINAEYLDPTDCCPNCFLYEQGSCYGNDLGNQCTTECCIIPSCPEGTLEVRPGECCPKCSKHPTNVRSANCSLVLCKEPECPKEEQYQSEKQCCIQCKRAKRLNIDHHIDCAMIRCQEPWCSPEKRYIPDGECCPSCRFT
ncbi:uncharacterized protein DDB_G0274171-like [Ornithodoros turicata]|uniref:uncharacterized protein DDB_G0274171-like n=1 Tax=Ornithodoros turicata TaxID=34597 RepID=UPI003138B589